MKLRTLIFLIAISLFPIHAKSYFGTDSNAPMIKMMAIMMELMSRFMLGDFGSNSNGKFPSSAMPYSMLPMSPLMSGVPGMSGMSGMSGMTGMSGMNGMPGMSGANSSLSPYNLYSQFTPFQQALQAKMLENQLLGNNNNNAIGNNNSMNGIWQALSGDVMAIYYDTNFIWTDGKNRHLVGKLSIKNANQLTIALSASKKILNFKFYRENNKFAVQDTQGQLHIFKRIY